MANVVIRNIFLLVIFLVLFKNALAIAATPPTLTFEDNGEKRFIVFNTNDFESKFAIMPSNGLKFSSNEFILGPKGKKEILANHVGGLAKEGIIYIKEKLPNNSGLKLENGIGLKYNIKEKPKEQNVFETTGYSIWQSAKSKYANHKFLGIILAVAAMLAVIFYKNETLREKIDYYRFSYKLRKNRKL